MPLCYGTLDRCRGEKILFCAGSMLKNGADYSATVQFLTFAAGIESLFMHAFADFAIIAAIREFSPVRPAPHTVYGCSRDLRRMVERTPLLSGFSSQLVIVCDSGYAGVAIFAIQSAACNQLLHHSAMVYF